MCPRPPASFLLYTLPKVSSCHPLLWELSPRQKNLHLIVYSLFATNFSHMQLSTGSNPVLKSCKHSSCQQLGGTKASSPISAIVMIKQRQERKIKEVLEHSSTLIAISPHWKCTIISFLFLVYVTNLQEPETWEYLASDPTFHFWPYNKHAYFFKHHIDLKKAAWTWNWTNICQALLNQTTQSKHKKLAFTQYLKILWSTLQPICWSDWSILGKVDCIHWPQQQCHFTSLWFQSSYTGILNRWGLS